MRKKRKYKLFREDSFGFIAKSPNGKPVRLVVDETRYWTRHVGGKKPHYVVEVRSLRSHRLLREICSVCDVE